MRAAIELTVHEKKEDAMGGTFERTFVLAVPVERAWQAFVAPREREKWFVPPGRDPLEHPDQPLIEGFEKNEYKIGEIDEHKRLSWSQSQNVEGDARWVDTTVVFEEVESGTRITITRSGFGDSEAWQLFVQSTGLGTDESIADLIAYMETGVPAGRHYSSQSKAPKGSLGAQMRDTGAGVRIVYVVPGGFAEEAGMRAGDLLYRLADASVFRRSDVWCVERVLKPGYELEAEYVRDGKLLTGAGRLSSTHYTELSGRGGA
jgi:uncharacterized protein YndB with AHSA1/START domain